MLFIALAVAWGLSATSRLRPVGLPANVDVVIMFLDLRGSTRWSTEAVKGDFRYVGTFIDELREWAWGQASVLPRNPPDLVKFQGDGFMFVWEVAEAAEIDDAVDILDGIFASLPAEVGA